MKYVRTKDNIYEIVNDYGSSCAVKSRGKRGKTAIDGFTIKYGLSYAPRADAIEELCDEFVGIDNDNYHFHFTELEKVDESYSYLNEEYKAFYAAIWTDKGLIYVAKMNDKGELELL